MFQYIEGDLALSQKGSPVFLKEIAKSRSRPFYLYDIDGMEERLELFLKATNQNLQVFFAMKANNNSKVLQMFCQKGIGVDVVSGGELQRVLDLGFSPKKIVFSGVGKSHEELSLALKEEVFQINVESLGELKALAELAERFTKKPSLALRINPNVDFKSHPYIKTGLAGHKFGFDEDQIPLALEFIHSKSKNLHFQGLSMHLGSQIFDLEPLCQALGSLKFLYENLKSRGFPMKTLDIGGGLGIDYSQGNLTHDEELIKKFGENLKTLFKDFSGTLLAEPGRFLTARFGLLATRVEYIKKTSEKIFAIVNTGMHHLLRPALYGASHKILPFKEKQEKKQLYEVVGPICETADVLARDCLLPPLQSGDWLGICDVGAYGFVMANSYNLHPLPEELSFSKGKEI